MARRIKIEIKNYWTDKVLFEYSSTDNTVKNTLTKAVKEEADLRGADLQGANLRGADLWEADLWGADIQGANLRGANLREADLREANLRGADLREADLRGANLREADLQGANLRGADLREANLREADLQGANLREADLQGAKNFTPIYQSDLAILLSQPGKLRAYKYLNGDTSPYQNHKYEIGKTYSTKEYDDDIFNLCGHGLNVATLDWCLRDTGCNLERTYIEVEFSAKDIVAIPYASDGKFRVKKLKVVRKLDKKELEKYLKSLVKS